MNGPPSWVDTNATGPPSWIDTGDGGTSDYLYGGSSSSQSGSGSDSLTYWEEKYGGGGGGNSSSNSTAPSFDASAFLPDYTQADRALAWFRLIGSCVFAILGTYALVRFHKSRWILDIRTRSSFLVVSAGAVIVLSYLAPLNDSIRVLFGSEYAMRWFWTSLILFFCTPVLFGSYVCRALRLAVVFHPRAKRALPWLIPERNYLWALLLSGVSFLAIPIYHELTLEIWEIIPKQTDILGVVSLTFAGLLASLYPFIRKVDDLFNISTELIIVSVFLIFLAAGQKLVYDFGGPEMIRWIGNNLYFVAVAIVFGVSVVDPLRRLAFDPLAASKRDYANRVLLIQRQGRNTSQTASSGVSSRRPDSEDERAGNGSIVSRIEEGRSSRASVAAMERIAGGVDYQMNNPFANGTTPAIQRRSGAWAAGQQEMWDFERLASTPLLASAFEDFSRKALCHESVLFLSEVSRYQQNDFSEPSGGPGPSQYDAYCRLADTFIRAGSRQEVNISDADKKRILLLYNKGEAWFEREDPEERRLVYGQAYAEVKDMLEANLLRRFLQTDQFRSVRAQREIVTTMQTSPLK